MEVNRNLLKTLLEHVKDKTPLLTHNRNMIWKIIPQIVIVTTKVNMPQQFAIYINLNN